MASEPKQELLKRIPPITELLKDPGGCRVAEDPSAAAGDRLPARRDRRRARGDARGSAGRCGPEQVTAEAVLARAAALLAQATTPHLARGDQRDGHHPAHGPGPGGVPRQRGGFDAGRTEGLLDAGRGSRERRADRTGRIGGVYPHRAYRRGSGHGGEQQCRRHDAGAGGAGGAEGGHRLARPTDRDRRLVPAAGSHGPEPGPAGRSRRHQSHAPQGLPEGHHRRHRRHHAGASQQLSRRRLHQRGAAGRNWRNWRTAGD